MKTIAHTFCVPLLLSVIFNACKTDVINSNHLIAYVNLADLNYREIYTSPLNGFGSQRISDLGAKNLSDSEYFPMLSPDGSKIRYRGFDFMIKVYGMDYKTIKTIETKFDSEWSTDSEKIV